MSGQRELSAAPLLDQLPLPDWVPLHQDLWSHIVLVTDSLVPPNLNRLLGADPGLSVAALCSLPAGTRAAVNSIRELALELRPERLLASLVAGPLEQLSLRLCTPWLQRLWTHSVACAHAARSIAYSRDNLDPDMAYLAGLLHELGLLAASVPAGQQLLELYRSLRPGDNVLAAERAALGMSHVELGRRLARRWRLPRWLQQVVAWHHHAADPLSQRLNGPLLGVVSEAHHRLADTPYCLEGPEPSEPLGPLPWQAAEPVLASAARGVRQAATLLADNTCREREWLGLALTRRCVELLAEVSVADSELDWQQRARLRFERLCEPAPWQTLLELIAQTVQEAAEPAAVLLYCRQDRHGHVGGWASFHAELARSFQWQLPAEGNGTDPLHAVLGQLPELWRTRPYQRLELWAEPGVAVELVVWLGSVAEPDRADRLEQAAALARSWLQHRQLSEQIESELDEAAAALERQQGEFERALQEAKLAALAQFAAGAGHEINNPLAVISGRAQLLLADEQDGQRRRALEIIAEQAQRIHAMIVELMRFARPPEPHRQTFNLAAAIDRALQRLRHQAQQRNIRLLWKPPAEPILVEADCEQLAAAIECIVQNSIEAIGQEGTIELTTSREGRWVALRISDTGGGMSEQVRQHAFEPFYSGRDAGRGLGMGLPKAWRLVSINNGSISLDSTDDGTVATIRLPACSEPLQQRHRRYNASKVARASKPQARAQTSCRPLCRSYACIPASARAAWCLRPPHASSKRSCRLGCVSNQLQATGREFHKIVRRALEGVQPAVINVIVWLWIAAGRTRWRMELKREAGRVKARGEKPFR